MASAISFGLRNRAVASSGFVTKAGGPRADEHEHKISSVLHSHSHNEDRGGAERIMVALRSSGDPGSRVTLVGLVTNLGLSASKGLAGWSLNSASLMADAMHSMSDLLSDFVTLFCWKWSRKPPTARYPYGFGKFETVGTTTVSLMLIGGALAIGFHSYYLFLETLAPTITAMPPGLAHDVLGHLVSSPITEKLATAHQHHHQLDPNAAWFALVSIFSKEWLYRITKRVADDQKSSVLLANAYHHRSDAYTSVVAFFAILGTWLAPDLPLDPLGGFLVALLILRQGLAILMSSLRELMDVGVSEKSLIAFASRLERLKSSPKSSSDIETNGSKSPSTLFGVQDIRAKRAGTRISVDLSVHVPSTMTVKETAELETCIQTELVAVRSEVSEVRVRFIPVEARAEVDLHPHIHTTEAKK